MNIVKKENLIMEENEQQFTRILSDSPINQNIQQDINLTNQNIQQDIILNDLNKSNQSNEISLLRNEFKYKLRWSNRDELINLFNYYNLLLEKDIIFNKDELIDKNNDLICVLSNLQLEIDNNLEPARKKYKSNDNETIGNNLLFVLITNKFRMMIIEKLILNINCAVYYRDSIEKDDQLKIKDENASVLSKLLDLEVDFKNLDDNLNENLDNSNEKLNDDLLNNELDERLGLIRSFGNQTNTDNNRIIADLENKITNLQNELINQSFRLEHLIKSRPEILLTYEFEGVKNFFKKEDQWFSNYFPASSFEWTIQIESTYDTKTRQRFLGLFLNIANSPMIRSYKMSWRCKTNFEIRLLSYTDSIHNRSTKHSYTYIKATRPNGVGTNKFMTLSDLFNPNFGFISNNKMMVQVLLEIESIDMIKLIR